MLTPIDMKKQPHTRHQSICCSTSGLTSRRSQPGLSLSVVRKDFSGFISQVPGGSAFAVRPRDGFGFYFAGLAGEDSGS
jgi:hypothetical protein